MKNDILDKNLSSTKKNVSIVVYVKRPAGMVL